MKEFWAQHSGFGFHPEDRPLIDERRVVRWTPRQAITHEWDYHTKIYRAKLHENLIPVTYGGNLSKARVFILMLNPGYRTACYLEDQTDREYQARMFDNLAQRLDHFRGLIPNFCEVAAIAIGANGLRRSSIALLKRGSKVWTRLDESVEPSQ